MAQTIRSQLLTQNLMTIAVCLVLVVTMVSAALWQLGSRQANDRLALGARAVGSSITARTGNLRSAVTRLAADKDLSSKAGFLQENASKADMASMVAQERTLLAVRFGHAMAATGAGDAACYAADGSLLCAAANEGDQLRLVIPDAKGQLLGVALAAGKDPQPDDWKPTTALAAVPVSVAGRKEAQVTAGCTVRAGSWRIEATAPILVESLNAQTFQMELVPRGQLVLGMPLDQAFLAEASAQTGLRLNLYAGATLAAGDAPDVQLTSMPTASPTAPADGLDATAPVFASARAGTEDCFTAAAAMRSAGADAGALLLLVSQKDMRQGLRWVVILTGVAGLIGALAALGLGAWRSRAITRPLANTVGVLQAMAAGDTSRRLDENGPRELVDLAQAVNRTVAGLRTTLERTAAIAGRLGDDATALDRSASTTAEAVARIAERSSTVAKQADVVSANVQSVASGAAEMTASIQEIARNTTAASEVASQAVASANTAKAVLGRLGESSKGIESVVQAIAGIAAQTNLLALNATIEAARAGEAGRGFAVVAAEVKGLARQAAEAAEDVARRVHALQSDAEGAGGAIGGIIEVIGRIDQLQAAVAAAVEQQAATASEMTRNAGDGSTGTSGIAGAIAEVAKDAGQGSAGAADTRSAAERLLALAGELRRVSG